MKNKKFAFILALVSSLVSLQGKACPSGTFTATHQDEYVAKIRGENILDSGWNVYSEETRENFVLTRFSKKNSNVALWRYVMTDKSQPGIVWGVWVDAGIVEGMENTYNIRTNVRSISRGDANLSAIPGKANSFNVNCGN
jgi:hypothetical protein